ncbi:MAG: cell division protein ZapA [Spirochaetales bacterium]|nr:cell division protein ZapA [Spirochaetales bacterium]
MASQLLAVKLLGSSFSLKSDENLDYLKEVVAYYQKKVEETGQSLTTGDPLKMALLAGILVTDELLKERKKNPQGFSPPEAEEAERITRSLIEKIDSILI